MTPLIAKESTRLAKELRQIILPVLVSLAALMLSPWYLRMFMDFHVDEFSVGCVVILVLSSAFVAAAAFGIEHRDRTFTLQLSQPLGRSRIWFEKVFVLVASLTILTAVCAAAIGENAFTDRYQFRQAWVLEVGIVLVTVAVGAAAFWSSVARSTIGTFSLVVATQWGVLLAAAFVMPASWPAPWPLLGIGAGVLLAAYACWSYSRAEAPGAGRQWFVAFAARNPRTAADDRFAAVRIYARGAFRNYLAKEIRLQRVSILFFLAFAGVVAAVDLLSSIQVLSIGPTPLEVLFRSSQILMAMLLAVVCGCLAVCEEKALGTAVFNSCLPRRAGWLFAGKFMVSLGIFAALLVLLQFLFVPSAALGLISPVLAPGDWLSDIWDKTPTSSLLFWLFKPKVLFIGLFLVSFWTSTLARDSAYAALLAVPVFVALLYAVAFGWEVLEDLPTLPVDDTLFAWLSAWGPPVRGLFVHNTGTGLVLGTIVGLASLGTVLRSAANFQIAEPRPLRFVLQLLGLAVMMAFVGAAARITVETPLRVEARELHSWDVQRRELEGALRQALQMHPDWDGRIPLTISWAELVGTGALKADTVARYANGGHAIEVRSSLFFSSENGRWIEGQWPTATISPAMPVAGNKYYLPRIERVEIRTLPGRFRSAW